MARTVLRNTIHAPNRAIARATFVALVVSCALGPVAEARPVSPLSGGIELGAAFFVGSVRDSGSWATTTGPLLHLGLRTPMSTSMQLGMTGRLGVGTGSSGSSATGSLALEARLMTGHDWAPYGLIGLGVIFQATRDATLDRLASEPRLAGPIGLGFESRIGESLMVGLVARYTAVLTHLKSTKGPFDVALYLTFL